MASTRDLDPRFRPWADVLLRVAKDLDIRFHFTSARRSRAEQLRLYNRYVKGESPYLALPPGRSQHERGLAVDLARLNVKAYDDDLLPELGKAWRSLGGVWGGDEDPVHFEAPRYLTGRS